MFLLGFHVFYHGVQLTRADRKKLHSRAANKISVLGREFLIHLDDFFFSFIQLRCERVLGVSL